MEKYTLPIIQTNGLTLPSVFSSLSFLDLLDCIDEVMNSGLKRGGFFDYKVLSSLMEMPITEKSFNNPQGLSSKSILRLILQFLKIVKNKRNSGEESVSEFTSMLGTLDIGLNKLLNDDLDTIETLLGLMLDQGFYKKSFGDEESIFEPFTHLVSDPSINIEHCEVMFAQVAPIKLSVKHDEKKQITEYQSAAAEWHAVVSFLNYMNINSPRVFQLVGERIAFEEKLLSSIQNQNICEHDKILSLMEQHSDLKAINPLFLGGNGDFNQAMFNYPFIFELLACAHLDCFEESIRESYQKNEGLVKVEMLDTYLSNAKKSLLALVRKNEKITFFECYLRKIYKLTSSKINHSEADGFEIEWDESSISKIALHLPTQESTDIESKQHNLKRYFNNSRTIANSELMGLLRSMVGDDTWEKFYFFILKLAIHLDDSKRKLSEDDWATFITEVEEGVSEVMQKYPINLDGVTQ